MKKVVLISSLIAILVSGCGPAAPGGASVATTTPGYSDSAPAKMLDAPNKARDAAKAANDRIKAAQDAIDK